MGNKSIGIKLDNAKSSQAKQKVLSDWVKNWKEDQENVIARLRKAAQTDNHSEVMHMISQLEGMTTKRFAALNNVLYKLSCNEQEERKNNQKSEEIKEEVKEEPEKPKAGQDIIYEVVKAYNAGMSIKEIAGWNHVNGHKIIKLLVTAGVYTSDTYDKIKNMREEGKTEEEIANKLNLGKKAMNDYTPYKKGVYNSENLTENAKRIRKSREKRKDTIDKLS